MYSTSGKLLTPALISNPLLSTGIAFDGTDFWTSNIIDKSLSEWTANGTLIKTLPLKGVAFGVEDLSLNYSIVIGVPEPATLGPLALGLAALGGRKWRPRSTK